MRQQDKFWVKICITRFQLLLYLLSSECIAAVTANMIPKTTRKEKKWILKIKVPSNGKGRERPKSHIFFIDIHKGARYLRENS